MANKASKMSVVALVSCVKNKRAAASPACDLYESKLLRKLRQYAEAHATVWYILSAEYGLGAQSRSSNPTNSL